MSFDRDFWSFWRPNFWDIVGVAVGSAGVYLTGAILVSVSLDAIRVIEFVGAAVLILSSVAIFMRVREWSAYPFIVHCISTKIVFTIDPVLRIPIGRLSREIEMSVRPNSPGRIDKFIWLTDPPQIAESDVRSRMEVQAKIITGKDKAITRSIDPQLKISDFRKLDMFYVLPEEAKQFRRFCLVEAFVLPNKFPDADEYYDIVIHDNAKRRTVQFEFETMHLVSARFAIIRGKREPIYRTVDIQRDKAVDRAYIQKEFGRLRVGDVLSFRWSWNIANHAQASPQEPASAVRPKAPLKRKVPNK